jgi:hypothetical protein
VLLLPPEVPPLASVPPEEPPPVPVLMLPPVSVVPPVATVPPSLVVPPVATVPPVPEGWHTPFIHSLPESHSVLLMHPFEPSLLVVRTQPLTNRTPALKPQRKNRRLTDLERTLVISRGNLAHGGRDAAARRATSSAKAALPKPKCFAKIAASQGSMWNRCQPRGQRGRACKDTRPR